MVSLVQINSKKVCFETEQMRFRLSLIQIQKSGLASFMPVTYFGTRTKKEMHLPLPLQTGNVIRSLSTTSRTLTGLWLFDQIHSSLTYFYCIAQHIQSAFLCKKLSISHALPQFLSPFRNAALSRTLNKSDYKKSNMLLTCELVHYKRSRHAENFILFLPRYCFIFPSILRHIVRRVYAFGAPIAPMNCTLNVLKCNIK